MKKTQVWMFTRVMVVAALGLAVLLGVIALLMAVYGERQMPESRLWQRLGFADCGLPCWANVTPGVTDRRDVPDLIAEQFGTETQQLVATVSVSFWTEVESQRVQGVIIMRGDTVGEVRLITALPLRQFILELGEPDCTRVSTITPASNQTPAIELYWEDDERLIVAQVEMDANGGWSLYSETQVVSLNASRMYICERGNVIPWLGFAPHSRYARVYAELYGG